MTGGQMPQNSFRLLREEFRNAGGVIGLFHLASALRSQPILSNAFVDAFVWFPVGNKL
jgi:hypothetical protein